MVNWWIYRYDIYIVLELSEDCFDGSNKCAVKTLWLRQTGKLCIKYINFFATNRKRLQNANVQRRLENSSRKVNDRSDDNAIKYYKALLYIFLWVELELLLSCGDTTVKYTFVVDAAVIYTKVERFKISLSCNNHCQHPPPTNHRKNRNQWHRLDMDRDRR